MAGPRRPRSYRQPDLERAADREVESWPRDSELSLHPRMQRLTLEIILRTVFGLEEGPRSRARAVRSGLTGGGSSPSGRPDRDWLPRPRKLSRGTASPSGLALVGQEQTSANRLP